MALNEMRQTRAQLVESMGKIHKAAERDQRDLTLSEREKWEDQEREVRRLDGAIAREEVQEEREKDLARTGGSKVGIDVSARWSNGGVRTGGGYERAEMIVNAKDSFRGALEERGMIRQKHYEHVTLGDLGRALFAPGKVDAEVRAALAEGADATGGYSVPDITMARFIDALRAETVCMRAGAVVVPLTSDKSTIARTATDPVCAWRSEAGPVAESEPTFEGVVFTARSLDVLIKASREVLEDSVNIEQAIDAAIRGAFACALDKAALVGSGTPPEPLGIAGTTNVGAVAAGGALTSYDKLCDAVYEILVDNAPFPTAMIMPPRTSVALGKLKTGITNDLTPLQMPPLLSGITQYVTGGLPITEAPGTASRVILGSFNQLYFGIRADLRIQIARELYAATGQVGFFANLRADIGCAHPQSFAQVTGIVP